MAGRPKKKPEYNPELQFNNFLQELRDAYEEADSLRSLADELNISLLKLRKLLITADVFTSDICTEINDLHQSGKKIPEIMKLTGLSRASVHSYLPYTKGIYNAAEISLNAERCRTYKNRQGKNLFLFLSNARDDSYFCRSFFPEEKMDYTKNQASWTLLYKKKRNLIDGSEYILYDRLKKDVK